MKLTSGMSLFQCCIVIALISFVSVLGLNFFALHSKSAIRFELEKLYAAIVYMQRKAIMTGCEQRIVVEPEKRRYIVEHKVKLLASGVTFGFLPNMWGPPAHPVYQIINSVTFKDNTIICYPDGTINAGSIYLTDTRARYFFALTSGILPTIYLRLYGYDTKHKKWHLIDLYKNRKK